MSIGIVGIGIASLHLALRLQQFGIDATLYAPQGPDEVRGGPPLNFVTRFASTRGREEALGITRWASSEYDNAWMHLTVEAPGGPSFRSRLPQPASSVDFRVYLPALAEEYVRRGGALVRRRVEDTTQLAALARQHDLVVVGSGRGALTDAFPRDPARSPYSGPRRYLAGGLFRGVRPADPAGMTMHIVPGAGEVHAPAFHTFAGRASVVLVEAVPDGPFRAVADRPYRGDPDRFARDVLGLVATYAPTLRDRIDEREFALTRPVDALQGAVVPVVRHGWAEPAVGRFALAIGDAWIVNDPLTAQGANLGSALAFQLADELRTHAGPYDDTFCAAVCERMWATAQPVVDWTNTFVGEMPAHVTTLLAAAADDQRVADAFVANLDRPAAMWHAIRRPEHTDELIAQARSVRSGA